jgi:hypothetical protein
MDPASSAQAVFDREFLSIRAKLIELAAAFDRVDRGSGSVADDPRLEKIRQGLEVLLEDQPGRAERIQMIFSRPYDPQWQTRYAQERA